MRRDYFELEVENLEWVEAGEDPRKPRVYIDFHGPEEELRERLAGSRGDLLAAEETDVAFRLQESADDPDATGVVGVTNRLTGDFVLELNEDADDVLRFITAAREYGKRDDGDGRYRVEIDVEGEQLVAYEKETFLVYDAEGNLLRHDSLIPSGVEL
ncbi:DUF5793 family protein [Candidatus Halobonum tyrrellensis]|uniref:Uncharacterized protein n=1 Tax=Candidatus Halobonum tyrrellensis G22 TaxID=1324957 RepID=V4HNZ6_9EURY|nr:DUF5793 family protein [Candidatus Halobonum tyrrellensis]ESP89644.1 hypothetical protein K933_02966 [Candidatus Halobonum tyrrellensis G22]